MCRFVLYMAPPIYSQVPQGPKVPAGVVCVTFRGRRKYGVPQCVLRRPGAIAE